MTNSVPDPQRAADTDAEPPLDPAVERVRRKLARLMVGSIGVMVLGLIAVFAAIVYKINTDAPASSGRASEMVAGQSSEFISRNNGAAFDLPAGASVLESDLDGNHVLIRAAIEGGGQAIFIFDMTSGSLLMRRALVLDANQ